MLRIQWKGKNLSTCSRLANQLPYHHAQFGKQGPDKRVYIQGYPHIISIQK
jgi:hypothetical protein